MLEMTAILSKKVVFKDRQTGKETVMFRVSFVTPDQEIGYLYSREEIQAGEVVDLVPAASKDGKLVLKLARKEG
jgi:hypothetical protein